MSSADGTCTISVAEDKSAATLTLVAANGGAPVTADQIHEALTAAGVVAGILPDEIEAALAAGSAADRVVARWREATDGEDATFACLLPEPEERRPHADEHGIIDYRDLGRIAAVRAGDPLMRRTPATAGTDGFDVGGGVLKARPGRNTPFSKSIKGAAVDPADVNLLRAAIAGRPTVTGTGVSVDPLVVFPTVDISSGNVEFDGAVTVEGDVSSEMRIRATGDVFIGGSVGAASITAGGTIVIKGGVIGVGETDDDVSAEGHAVIRCEGAFQAHFLQYAHIESAADILVEDHCVHSTLQAGARIVVGGSGAGHIRGGTSSAATLVKAVTLGSTLGVKTTVRVGVGAKDEQALAAAKVVVDRNVHSGTEIHIDKRCWTSTDDRPGGVFRLVDGDIVFGA